MREESLGQISRRKYGLKFKVRAFLNPQMNSLTSIVKCCSTSQVKKMLEVRRVVSSPQ